MSVSLCKHLTIAQLVDDANVLPTRIIGDTSAIVSGITLDSRNVEEGDLFCCISGDTIDGHAFASDAVKRGARALVVERELSIESDIPQIVVVNTRRVVGVLASALYNWPSRKLSVVGITGTNGKTSTAALIGHILEVSGRTSRVFGTLTGERTTPEATELQRRLAECVRDGVSAVVMEVSSHALAQYRVDGTTFALAVFTNLGRDHLDFHGTVEAYFSAKSRLFDAHLSLAGIANIDDPHGQLLCDSVNIPMTGFSQSDVSDVVITASSVSFAWSGEQIETRIGGGFNVMNVLAACTAARNLGIAPKVIANALSTFSGVRGRFEYVNEGQNFGVIVDYAHTPEALDQLLSALRQVASGKVIAVFGCGGDRDPGKRPLMGRVAQQLADVVYLTSDNPRTENPHDILHDVSSGFRDELSPPIVEEDRATAIQSAINSAQIGDIVVIAGKGHETVQELKDRTVEFDDVAVARAAIRERNATK